MGYLEQKVVTQKKRLPRTRAEYARALSDATVTGYFAGFSDRHNGKFTVALPSSQMVRRAVRAEIARWMK